MNAAENRSTPISTGTNGKPDQNEKPLAVGEGDDVPLGIEEGRPLADLSETALGPHTRLAGLRALISPGTSRG